MRFSQSKSRSTRSSPFAESRAWTVEALTRLGEQAIPGVRVLTAIRRVARGGTYVSARIGEKLAADLMRGSAEVLPHERLSDRELEVLRLLDPYFGLAG